MKGLQVVEGLESFFFGRLNDEIDGLPFRAGFVKKSFIFLAIGHYGFFLAVIHALPYGFGSAVCCFHDVPPHNMMRKV